MWTDERVSTLKRLRREGLTFTQCADEMGLTLGQVAGKVNRLQGYRRYSPPADERPRGAPSTVDLIAAAALVAEGASITEAARETALDYHAVYFAVLRSKERERIELLAMEGEPPRTAWNREALDDFSL